MNQPIERVYEFGPFRYDPGQRLLFRNGEVAPLMPKAIDTLHVLLERRGRVVEKAELMKLVWPDTVIEEVGLARNISLLRKVLEGEGVCIETIPRRGYRFVAPVTEIESQLGRTTPRGEATPPAQRSRLRLAWWLASAISVIVLGGIIYWQFYTPSKYLTLQEGAPSLAVVPFECLSAEPDGAAFCQGFSELLVADLAKLGGISVVAPSTVRRHQRMGNSMGLMGRLLGLEVLVEGTIREVGGQIRITPKLVDVHTGRLIWADSYEYPAAEWDRIETGAAREVAAQVGAHLAIHGAFRNPGAR